MWAALIRNIAVFMFTKRGKKLITLLVAILLCFISTLLLDARLYLSAALTGVLAAATLMVFAVQHFRQRRYKREREQRKIAGVARRAEAAAARSEKIHRAKTSAIETAKGVSSSAAGMAKSGVSSSAAGIVGIARTSFTETRDRLGSWRSKVVGSNKVAAQL
jgi:Ca2+/Na+ antiporter